MSVVVTLNVNAALKVLVFEADDYRLSDVGDMEVLKSTDTLVDGYSPPPYVVATVRDWSAVSIDVTPIDEVAAMVARAVDGKPDAAPCEACAKREERLADSLARQQRVRDQFFDDIRNRGNG